jgi:hypothetical protein
LKARASSQNLWQSWAEREKRMSSMATTVTSCLAAL